MKSCLRKGHKGAKMTEQKLTPLDRRTAEIQKWYEGSGTTGRYDELTYAENAVAYLLNRIVVLDGRLSGPARPAHA